MKQPRTLVDHFVETTRKPMIGPAHVPSRVRIESPELAAQLRVAVGGTTEVICAATPDIDAVIAPVREHVNAHDYDEPPTWARGSRPTRCDRFFVASARLFRTAPLEGRPR